MQSHEAFEPSTASLLANLADIPEAKIEIETISDLFGVNETTTFINAAATKKNLVSAIERERPEFISFATHSFKLKLRGENQSVLLLHGDPKDPSSIFLTPEEIIQLGLSAENVLLSACETFDASSENTSFDDTLVSSFLLNGSKAVVASGWPIDDRGTREFMFKLIKIKTTEGVSLSKAMQLASKEMIGGEFSSPYYWSAFKLIGR